MIHKRAIFPVGHGGFAVEAIDEFLVAYDCGTQTSPTRLQMYISALNGRTHKTIDYLFISHFDNDHVNGIDALLKSGIRVRRAVMSYIPHDLREAYNMVTNGAYNEIRNMLLQNDCAQIEVGEENDYGMVFTDPNRVWEWIGKSMMDSNDFGKIYQCFNRYYINISQLSDPYYVNIHKSFINKAFKTAFGPQGPNAKGLIVLSQKAEAGGVVDGVIGNNNLTTKYIALNMCEFNTPEETIRHKSTYTGCLYVGDARIHSKPEVEKVCRFWRDYCHEDQLLLMQLPHHGSTYNINDTLHQYITADLYYVNDSDDNRIHMVQPLHTELSYEHRLCMVRDINGDLLFGRIEF